ncbi:MAG: DsbA family protein [Chitinophagaceae bacterium]|nr:DsbA family protein [Chitinophagaceae bacterium]
MPLLIYCFDAYCGWCYGFSPVIKRIAEEYKDKLSFEVLSGGMILPQEPTPVSSTASYIQKAYKTVEVRTGIKFGEDYLWHIFNPDKSDWFPDSEKPAVAMCIFKEYHPSLQVQFAADLQHSLHWEGRDLTDDEAYRHLLAKYNIPEEAFYVKLKDGAYIEKANYEFALVKQLKVSGFPTAFIQADETKFYLVAQGFTEYEHLKKTIDDVLYSITNESSSF